MTLRPNSSEILPESKGMEFVMLNTPFRKANHLGSVKLRTFLTGCFFAAVSFAAVDEGQAQKPEAQFPMPAGVPFDPSPTDPIKSEVDKILVYAYDGDGNQLPLKTIKITNIHKDTVYPIFRDGNEAVLASNANVGLYNPYDTVKREYRGYIGYKAPDGKYYFGLESGESILVRVPLVFWNGARMGLVTDGKYLVPANGVANPLNYDPSAQKIIVSAEQDNSDSRLIKNGVVMWYKGGISISPALDAPDQLVEWTIRDKDYLSSAAITARTNGEIPASEKVDLINYDVSYVDNMFLPVAMEALDVPIPAPPYPPGKKPQPYGWIGAINKVNALQNEFDDFTKSSNNKDLGTYFGGKGWPIYNIPMEDKKIPAGQNVFAQSPLADTRSNYVKNTYMLSTGGGLNDPIFVNIIGAGTASSGTTLTLGPSEPISKFQFLKPGYSIVAYPNNPNPNPIQPGTKVVSVNVAARTVELSKPLVAPESPANYDFIRTVDDYASNAMIKIWYSWAKYYLDNTRRTPQQSIEGSIANLSATLRFSAPRNSLVAGMQVTGPGLPDPNPSMSKGGVVVLGISDDKKSVTLSQLSAGDQVNQTYTFKAPQPLPSTPDSLFILDFSRDPKEPSRVPLEFARTVYLTMASMAQIPKNPDKAAAPHVLELMNNVIGGNMGQIFQTEPQRFSEAGLTISAIIRDMIKSELRGVSDFLKFPEFDGNKQIWYPAPSVGRGGQSFNVYNLDPFVWFVHVQLGFSGYGFSLDDDTADVGAGQATKMLITIGGPPAGNTGPNSGTIETPENADEWTIQAPYGPVSGTGQWDPNETVSFYLAITGATNASPIVISSIKHGLSNGDKVFIDQVGGNTAANGGPFTVANVTINTFELLGSTGNGTYTSGGRWTTGPLPYITFSGADIDGVYWRIKGDDKNAGFQGAYITGPGVRPRDATRVVQLGNNLTGQLALSEALTSPGGKPLPKGNYKWTFSGTLPKK